MHSYIWLHISILFNKFFCLSSIFYFFRYYHSGTFINICNDWIIIFNFFFSFSISYNFVLLFFFLFMLITFSCPPPFHCHICRLQSMNESRWENVHGAQKESDSLRHCQNVFVYCVSHPVLGAHWPAFGNSSIWWLPLVGQSAMGEKWLTGAYWLGQQIM